MAFEKVLEECPSLTIEDIRGVFVLIRWSNLQQGKNVKINKGKIPGEFAAILILTF